VHVSRAPYPPGIALMESGGGNLRERVVPGPVIAGHYADRAMLAAFEEITRCGREDLDPASVEDLQDVLGKGAHQPPVRPVGSESADFLFQLVVEADQIGHNRIQDDAPDPVTKSLVLLMQAVNDRLPVGRPPVEPAEMLLELVQPPAQLSEQHRNIRARVRGRWRYFPRLGFFSAAAEIGLASRVGGVFSLASQDGSPLPGHGTAIKAATEAKLRHGVMGIAPESDVGSAEHRTAGVTGCGARVQARGERFRGGVMHGPLTALDAPAGAWSGLLSAAFAEIQVTMATP
jgi:hypothetical protein